MTDRQTDRQKKKEKSQSQRQREGEKMRKKKQTNMFGTHYATKWNETSYPKSDHVYLLFHQQIPAIQSKNIIPKGHQQHTIKPHFHSASIFINSQSYGQQ